MVSILLKTVHIFKIIIIVCSRGNHWIVASTIKCEGELLVFDLLHDDLDVFM